MSKEAMKLELEALEYASTGNRRPELITPAIIALRQAIDQADQAQPVAWIYESVCGKDFATCNYPPDYAKNIRALYTAPPRQPLTDEEIIEATKPKSVWEQDDYIQVARAIEAAHGIGEKK